MARELTYRWSYDVPPLRAFQVRNRLDYLTAKGRELDQLEFKVLELRERDGLFRCVSQMQIEAPLPAWARRLFSARNTVTTWELWRPPAPDGARRYEIRAEIQGVPATIQGWGEVSPVSPSDCRFDIALTVSSRMPIFGARLENLVAEHLDRILIGEREFSYRWLAGNHGLHV